MNEKLVFLLLGVLVKQTVDEFKAIAQKNSEELKDYRKRLATCPDTSPKMAGSVEAYRAIMEARHANDVAPELKRLDWRISLWKYAPFASYLLITLGLCAYALWLP